VVPAASPLFSQQPQVNLAEELAALARDQGITANDVDPGTAAAMRRYGEPLGPMFDLFGQPVAPIQQPAPEAAPAPTVSRRQLGLDFTQPGTLYVDQYGQVRESQPTTPDFIAGAGGDVAPTQYDLLGQLVTPESLDMRLRGQTSPVELPPTVSRRQLGLGLETDSGPVTVNAGGTAALPGSYPPVLDTARVERGVFPPEYAVPPGAIDRAASKVKTPQELSDIAAVAAAFGPQVAAQEQARRRDALVGDPAAHRRAVFDAFKTATGGKVGTISREVTAVSQLLRERGVIPTDANFAAEVRRAVVDRQQVSQNSTVLGHLDNAYPEVGDVAPQQSAAESVANTSRPTLASFGVRADDLSLPPATLAARHIQYPISSMEPSAPQDLPLGSIRVAAFGDVDSRYVDVLREVPVDTLLIAEPEANVRKTDVYQRYVELARAGVEAPFVQVNENDRGELVSSNRRRVMAAKEAGVPTLRAWVSPINPVTGDPLKYSDLRTLAQQAAAAPAVAPQPQQPAAPIQDLLAQLDTADTIEAVYALNQQVLMHPERGSLTAADHGRMATAVSRLTGAKFELGAGTGAAKPINAALFTKGVETANANLSVPVQAFDTVAALSAATNLPVPQNTKGMYHNGQVYVVRENIAGAKDLAFTIAHEVGHGGMAQLLGNSLRSATNRLWANADLRERMKLKQAEGYSRADAGEEVLVDMLASGERLNNSLWAKLRAGVMDFFARVFGMRGARISNADVDALLSDVARVLRGAPAAQVRADMTNPELWLTDVDTAAAQEPKFAKTKIDLARATAEAATEQEGRTLPFGHIIHAAASTTMDHGRTVVDKLKENAIGSSLMHNFLGLDNITDWYDHLFNPEAKRTGGLLRSLYDTKERQNAEFNRLNAAERDLYYTTLVNGKEQTTALGKKSVNQIIDERSEFRRTNPAKDQLLDYALTDGTFYRVHPDRSWEDQVHKDIDYAALGFTEEQRRAAHGNLRKAWQQMGATAQRMYKETQSAYAQRWNEYNAARKASIEFVHQRALADAAGKGADEAAARTRADQAIARFKAILQADMGRVQQGPYSPLMRHGDHILTVRDEKGDVVHASAYDSAAEANAAAGEIEQARKEAGETVTISVGIPRETDFDGAGVSRSAIAALRTEVLELLPADMDAEVREASVTALVSGLAEAYLRALPAKSFAKHAISRKNVSGYDTDSLRALANYAQRSARAVSSMKYDGPVADALNKVDTYARDVARGAYAEGAGVRRVNYAKIQDVANAVRNQHIAASKSNENRIVNAATGAAFLYQLTSPSHLLFNMTQTAMVSFPRLAGQYGTGRANREIVKAMGQFSKSGFDLLGEKSVLNASTNADDQLLLETLTRIRENGPLDLSQAHDASGVADGSSTALSPYWGAVLKAAAYPMHKSEVFNRQITSAAAVRLELAKRLGDPATSAAARRAMSAPVGSDARNQLVSELTRVGEEAIRTTQFNYARYNKGKLQQNPVGKLMLQYKTYQINMLSMVAKDIRDAQLGKSVAGLPPMTAEQATIARRTLAWTLGMQLALTGAVGTVLAPFVFAVLDAFKDDDDLTDSRTDFINGMAQLGVVGNMVSKGVVSAVLDTRRIGSDSLIPILGQGQYAPVDGSGGDTFMYYLTQNLGPAFGLGKKLATGVVDMTNGDVAKAIPNLLPKPMADLHTAYYDSREGVRDARGIVYFDPSVAGLAMTAVGLNTGARRTADESRGAVYRARTRARNLELRYLNRLTLAMQRGDVEGIAEARADIDAFNAKYPDMAITAQDMTAAVRGHRRAQYVASQTGVVSSRLPGQTILDIAGPQ
jgi:hypothetical protein